jgi:hypothetical protein
MCLYILSNKNCGKALAVLRKCVSKWQASYVLPAVLSLREVIEDIVFYDKYFIVHFHYFVS